MNKDTIYWIIIIALGGLAFYFWYQGDLVNSNLRAKEAVLKESRLENGMLLSSIESFKVSQSEIENQLWIKDDSLKVMLDRFKSLVGTVSIKTITKVDTIKIPISPPSIDEPNRRYFWRESPYYTLHGYQEDNFLRIDSLRIPNEQRIVIGKKKGFWNQQITVDVNNSNPLIVTDDIDSQIVVKNAVKRFGFGPFIGLDVTLRPTFGVGMSYDLFRF